MPVTKLRGDIFESSCEVLTCPVNTFGLMGAGLAKAFRLKFPDVYETYRTLCLQKSLEPGAPALMLRDSPPSVLLWPTKRDWRFPSRLEWIESAIPTILGLVKEGKIASLAVPAVGCGLGGLPWEMVEPVLMQLDTAPVPIELYLP